VSHVVAVAGRIGAGKSLVADELARVYSGTRRSFGGVVRRRAQNIGLPLDRDSLQELGNRIILTDGWELFCREVFGDTTDRAVLVVDGVRHVGAIDAITEIVGEAHFRLVYVEATRAERVARVMARDGITDAAFEAAEAHPNERELPLVRTRADVVIDNRDTARAVPSRVQEAVSALAFGGFVPPTP